MQVKSKKVRILKFLGKSILGLLIGLLGLILLLHLPGIQRYITQQIPEYLSEKIGVKVELQKLSFSVLGCVQMHGLKIWDPKDEMILSIDSFDLTTNFLDILSGDFHFKKVKLRGVYGYMTQEQNEIFNIQFILDAFSGTEKSALSSNNFQLKCDSLILEDIDFSFASISSKIKIDSRLEILTGTNILFSSEPPMMQMDTLRINQHHLVVLSESINETVLDAVQDEKSRSMSLDLEIGIGVTIAALSMSDNTYSFHSDSVMTTQKFDPKHIDADKVFLNVSDFLLHQDTLNFNLSSFRAERPEFALKNGTAEIRMNQQTLGVKNLSLRTANSILHAEILMGYISNTASSPNVDLKSTGQLTIDDFSFFLPDSIDAMIGEWKDVSFIIDSKSSSPGVENIDLDVRTTNSHLAIAGEVIDVINPNKLSWNSIDIRSSVGNDFRRLLQTIIGESNLPPGKIGLQMISSGNRKKMSVDGRVESTWGNAAMKGNLMPANSGVELDMDLSSGNLKLGEYLNYPWLGAADLAVSVKGSLGAYQNFQINGLISSIEVYENTFHQIQMESHFFQDSLITTVSIHDSNYQSQVFIAGSLKTPTHFSSVLHLDHFKLGNLIPSDTLSSISGDFTASFSIDQETLQADLKGLDLSISSTDAVYALDSLSGSVYMSPDSSYFLYRADDGQVDFNANFNLREMREVLNVVTDQILQNQDYTFPSNGTREFKLKANLNDPGLLLLAGVDIDYFSSLQLEATWEERDHKADLKATTGKISAYEISYDTMGINLNAAGVKIISSLAADNLFYKSSKLGDLNFELVTKADSSSSNLRLILDSLTLLSFDARVSIRDDGIAVYPDKLIVYDQKYQMNAVDPLVIMRDNILISGLTISRDEMQISLDGDLNAFDLDLKNLNLQRLDPILFPEDNVIQSGRLEGKISFVQNQHLDIVANVDSLVLLNANPLSIEIRAETKEDNVPFEVMMTNGGSDVSIIGVYAIHTNELDAIALMDIDSIEMFRIFYNEYLEDVSGAIKGKAEVKGSLEQPVLDGFIRFRDFEFSTISPKLSFNVKDDSISFNNRGLVLKGFTLFDNLDNPLRVSGNIKNEDYKSLSYDLNIKTDHYALINRPVNAKDDLNGLLVLGTDIDLKGNGKDTYVKADILIKDTTKLVLTLPDRQNQLLSTAGVIEFVDPAILFDSTTQVQSQSTYDSLIAGLPDFTLTATINIEEEAGLTIYIDPQSGDYFEVTGKANLDLSYDRTGNPVLNGSYKVTNGVYSLSFYDLVKKDFKIVKGSSISWTGGPQDGALDIKAVYNLQSNSIGLVGHEVGDNEKSVYKKTLNYEVSININGTIREPVISFSLDLPTEDKITYPALASKLSRLRLPEFQSELNKQVFGLLVLGSFLPETSGAYGGHEDMATTALYNSVNSLLAGQLNKFTGQYIKGVNIDVGLQTYSDYATNGGKTKTSMDFRVSKSLLDERLVFEIGGDFDIGADQSGGNQGKSYRGDVAIIYDLTGDGDKLLKLFNNESYDIIYQEIRNTGLSLIFIREFNKGENKKKQKK